MPRPRVAISQAPYQRDLDACLARAERHLRQARARNMDLVVFPEWFLGLNPVEVLPNRHTERLAGWARELGLTVVTGSLRVLDENGRKQQRGLVVDSDGTIKGSQAKITFHPTERPWFEPGTAVGAIPTRWGRIVILLGLDAESPDIWRQVEALKPAVVVMAASPRSAKEREQLQELAVTRSLTTGATVALAPLLGRFTGQSYLGGALLAHGGRVLAAATDQEQVVMSGEADAPLVQLGVIDAHAVFPVAPTSRERLVQSRRVLGSEAERRVVLDWDGLRRDPAAVGRELLQLTADNPRWAALAPAKPGAAADLEALLLAGARGAFLYPGLDGLRPYDPAVMELGRILNRLARPAMVHTGPGPAPLRLDRPLLWDEFAAAFPAVPLIVAHMGGRRPLSDEALLLAARHPQVYLETSGAPLEVVREALATVGAGRVLFGSGGMTRDFEAEWQKVAPLQRFLGEADFHLMTHQVARTLFFTEPPAAGAGAPRTGPPRLEVVRGTGHSLGS